MPLAIQVILGFVPSFAWLLFYLQEDLHPEPRRILAVTFINGAAFAFIALALQFGLKSVLAQFNLSQLSIVGLLIFAGVEEVLKFAAAYAAVHKSPEFDHPVDAMTYIIVAALGFATVENIGVLLGGSPSTMILGSVFHVITFRFIGATLLHTLASGIVGYYWALSIRHFRAKTVLFFGLALATVLHAAFNYGVLHYREWGLSVALLMIAGFFVLANFEKLRPKVV